MTPGYVSRVLLLSVLFLLIVGCRSDDDTFMESIDENDQVELQHVVSENGHTLPTLLSVVDPLSGDYILASNNPLYNQWYDASIRSPNQELYEALSPMPRLTLDRTELSRIRDSLTISWRDVLAKPDDFLVLHCENDLYKTTTPPLRGNNDLVKHNKGLVNAKSSMLEIATIAQAQATSRKHGGTEPSSWFIPNFPVTMYDACQFVLYRNDHSHAEVEDTTDGNEISTGRLLEGATILNLIPVAFSDVLDSHKLKDMPTQLHLAFGDNPRTMVAQFTTAVQGTPVANYYETSKGKNSQKVSGTSHTYTASDMCGPPANLTQAGCFQAPGMLHVVELTNLKPNTRYSYKVGLTSGQGIVWSDQNEFVSPPVVGTTPTQDIDLLRSHHHHHHHFDGNKDEDGEGDKHCSFAYVVYGDQGCPSVGWGQGGEWVTGMLGRELEATSSNSTVPISSVHHFGDLSYARGNAAIWEEWFNMMEPVASKIPLMIGVGNHVSFVADACVWDVQACFSSDPNPVMLSMFCASRNTTIHQEEKMGRIQVA